MTHLSLFSGIGGIDLAAEWAGFKTIQFVEKEPYCQKVLAKNFPGVPIHDDITTFDGRRLRGRTDIVSAGFPCQPHSVAGKRLASGDERDLWGEVVRVLGEAEPQWFVGENVPGLFTSESGAFFGRILSDLAALGYRVGWCCYGASDVGAVHRRKRIFLIARHPQRQGLQGERACGAITDSVTPYCSCIGFNGETVEGLPKWHPRKVGASDSGGISTDTQSEQARRLQREWFQPDIARDIDASDSGGCGCSGEPRRGAGEESAYRRSYLQSGNWREWDIKLVVRRSDDGLSGFMVRDRVKILKALGNAVCPDQAQPIFEAIAEHERRSSPNR